MLLTKFHPALILPIALFLVSCSVSRNLTSQTQTRDQIKALHEEVGKLEQNLLSMRTEIQELSLRGNRQTDRTDTEEVETVTETFDTDKPTDPGTGTPPLKSRTTERRGNHSTSTVNESAELETSSRTEARDSSRAEMAGGLSEALESKTESKEDFREEAAKKSLTWGQKTLMYCGVGAILIAFARIAFKLYKPRFSGVLTKIKQLLNNILR